MGVEVIIPSPGESITQVQLVKWLVEDGEQVDKDQEVVEIDSDKASFPLSAPVDGIIHLMITEGETIPVGTVIASVEPGKEKPASPEKKVKSENKTAPAPAPIEQKSTPHDTDKIPVSPLAGKMITEKQLEKEEVAQFTGKKRITRKDIEAFIEQKTHKTEPEKGTRTVQRKKLSMLRLKLAERLVAVRSETAMLTTFNEVNMQKVLEIKDRYQEAFRQKYGVSLGIISFFTKAVTMALREFPQVNSMIDGEDLVTPDYVDIGIAVSAPKGLVVPVIRNTESLDLPDIEIKVKELAAKARENRITLDDMKGGTFTITNGGVFGSLMSTPILNPPQSAILGLHKIVDRPVAVEGRIEIEPMMYLALSYDHRVIDGRESVTFLVKVKEYIENPLEMLLSGEDPMRLLLDI